MKKINYVLLALFAWVLLVGNACTEQKAEVKMDYQIHRASINMSKAFRQFQMADNAYVNDKDESAENHLSKGLDFFQEALDHLSKAEDANYQKASIEIDKGNKELQKSIDEYADGNDDSAAKHYANALDYYDKALGFFD